MPSIDEALGSAGFIKQLFVYQVLGQVVSALMSPAFTVLLQDTQAAHPEIAITPEIAARLLVRHMISPAGAQAEAAKGGIDAARFGQLVELETVRLQPADLAELELRAQLTAAQVDEQARPQGLSPEQMRLLAYLAGDALGPQQLAEALQRGIIARHGRGADSTSFDQGIAESRLHDKWGPILADLARRLLPPPDAASAVVRHFGGEADMAALAEKQGIDAETFRILIHLAGDAPGPQQLAEALRRQLIDRDGTGPASTSFMQGIAEGRLADKWAHVIEGLAQLWPTPTDALHAEVEGQLTHDQATELYARLGGNPEFRQWLFNTIGEGPTPLEAGVLAARGIIPWQGTGPDKTTFEQAVRESRYRNKWTDAYRRLGEHIPPPSTVTTWLARNIITDQRAHELLLADDMAPDLAAAYIADAEFSEVSDYRGLQVSGVTDMYLNHLISRDQAQQLLAVLHVTAPAAKLLLDYADMRYLIDSINRSVQRIAQLFTSRKIGAGTATNALLELKIPAGTVDQILQTWELQAAADVKTLTAAQIIDAWRYGVFTQDEAQAELQVIGYTAFDAWALMSIKVKQQLPGKPKREVAAPPPAVIPGTT